VVLNNSSSTKLSAGLRYCCIVPVVLSFSQANQQGAGTTHQQQGNPPAAAAAAVVVHTYHWFKHKAAEGLDVANSPHVFEMPSRRSL
jgi:hypothetical protein